MKNYFKTARKMVAGVTLLAFVVTSFGLQFTQSVTVAQAAETTAKVTIIKYIDGVKATAVTANSAEFQMNATYTINGTSGSGQYALTAGGYNGDPTPYQAMTSDLPIGTDYGTSEIIDGTVVTATCAIVDPIAPFTLVGYTTGNTLAEAAAATPTQTVPNFVGLTSDKFVIVWNQSCLTPVVPQTSVKVTIEKFMDGAKATASSTDSASFPMSSTWNATNVGEGTGGYELTAGGYNGNPTPYQAMTADMTPGANYSTYETLGGSVVGASCSTAQPFALVGYTTGGTLAEAMVATKSTTTPSFTNMTTDKFVIVWNKTCSDLDGIIDGTVTGGSSNAIGVLKVTDVAAVKTTAIADGTFASGWRYEFSITVPTNETHLSMKFADWMSVVGSTTLAVANNMRISSPQANNSGATVLVTGAGIYTLPTLNMTDDLNPALAGKQVLVVVEVAVPATTVNGAYSTTFGVKTE